MFARRGNFYESGNKRVEALFLSLVLTEKGKLCGVREIAQQLTLAALIENLGSVHVHTCSLNTRRHKNKSKARFLKENFGIFVTCGMF